MCVTYTSLSASMASLLLATESSELHQNQLIVFNFLFQQYFLYYGLLSPFFIFYFF